MNTNINKKEMNMTTNNDNEHNTGELNNFGSIYDRYEGYGYEWDIDLMDDLMKTYGWIFKPLEPLESFNNMSGFKEKDVARLDFCNEMLLEYCEDNIDTRNNAADIEDRRIIVHVATQLADREGTRRGNIYQWMSSHIRLEYSGPPDQDEWVHQEEHQKILNEVSDKKWKEGFFDAVEELSDK